jgi:large subunit ribosomal protein L17
MRHGKSGKKLGRTSSHRKAMLRNMVTSLFKYEKIQTTDSKAKELRKVADKMVTLGKRGDLHARRQAASYVRDSDVVVKLFSDLSERFRERNGGYTRTVKTGYRVGDNAPMSIVELIGEVKKAKGKTKAKAKAKKKAAAAS